MFNDASEILKVQRKILEKAASEIFFSDKDKKLCSRTMSKWIQVCTGNSRAYQVREVSFGDFKLFIDFCEFKNFQRSLGITTQKITHQDFLNWRKAEPDMLATDELAKQYLLDFGTEAVMSQGRHLVNYCDRVYPGKYIVQDFYNWSKSVGFKFTMGDMKPDQLNTLYKIAENMKFTTKSKNRN